uniref:Uncharacterized protein n=1 Tax=Oryza glaberrima TaxID=4538 RepID=I1PTQ9_ORYGL
MAWAPASLRQINGTGQGVAEAGKGLLTRSRGRRPFSRPHSSQRRGILGTWEQEIMGGKGQIGRCRLPRVQCDWEAWWSTMMAWQGVGEEL